MVTENAYFPLQFAEPKSGQPDRLGTGRDERTGEEANFKVEYQNTSWTR